MSDVIAFPVFETSAHAAERLILAGANRAYLAANGLAVHGVTFPDESTVRVHLVLDDEFHVHLDTHAFLSSPDLLAYRVLRELDTHPTCWTATWRPASHTTNAAAPRHATRHWTRIPDLTLAPSRWSRRRGTKSAR